MARKTNTAQAAQTNIAEVTTAVPRKKRTPTILPPEIQELVDEARLAARTAIGGAKRLGKAVTIINEMGEWELDQIPAAIERRRNTIATMP